MIVMLAQDLALDPSPAGTGPNLWKASCPERKRSLEIQASRNLFYCGDCQRVVARMSFARL